MQKVNVVVKKLNKDNKIKINESQSRSGRHEFYCYIYLWCDWFKLSHLIGVGTFIRTTKTDKLIIYNYSSKILRGNNIENKEKERKEKEALKWSVWKFDEPIVDWKR